MSLKNILLHEIISQSLTDTEDKLVVTIGERNGGRGGFISIFGKTNTIL